MPVIVAKFGGSSLADAAQFRKVADIVKADVNRRYVVPSAPGKRFGDDIKVTDMLYDCYSKARRGENFDEEFSHICARFQKIINELELDLNLENEFEYIHSAFLRKAGKAYAASRGEYLCGLVLASYLGYDFVDAARVVCFTDEGHFDAELTNATLAEELAKHEHAVIPGFYGSTPNDSIMTFTRGGSDITGALVARAVKARMYENWTDVSGFLAADPRVVSDPERIDVITYRELRELSYMGATVLHEDTIFPVYVAGITINIRNTNDVEAPGTFIVADASDSRNNVPITGIAGKKGFSTITVEKAKMKSQPAFIRNVLEIMEQHGTEIEHLPSGIDTISAIVNTKSVLGHEDDMTRALNEAVNADSVVIEHGLALIAVVGRGMVKSKGTAARIFGAISGAGINIHMIDQGASELNIVVAVQESDFESAVQAIYQAFFA